jgi:hypothetical protein
MNVRKKPMTTEKLQKSKSFLLHKAEMEEKGKEELKKSTFCKR